MSALDDRVVEMRQWEYDELRAENAKLRATLEWYGNPSNWEWNAADCKVPAAGDSGKRARAALEETK